ncbi:MAG: hypothetical protein OXK78_02650, partial [Caldilineaceae bacterium]|nr:hypothetical protein [Caldilineaceae bacterium]
PPPQRPLSYNLAPQRVCGKYEVVFPRRPALPDSNRKRASAGKTGEAAPVYPLFTTMTIGSPLQKI